MVVTYSDRPDVQAGDVVETPLGDQTVVEINHMRDTLLTEDPSTGLVLEWKCEEVEEIAQPDLSDSDAVERWLRIKAIVVPSLEIQTTTIRCLDSCPCSFCYRIHKRLSARGTAPRVEITHHIDNEACQCSSVETAARVLNPLPSSCPDCACMKTVNIRWAP